MFYFSIHIQLSSDAHSAFTRHSPNKEQDNAEIKEATKHLHEVVIPNFAKKLENLSEKELTEFKFARLAHMVNEFYFLHKQEGVNVRHLGKVRQHLKSPKSLCSVLLLIEIAARIIKNRIRRVQEKEMERVCTILIPLISSYVKCSAGTLMRR